MTQGLKPQHPRTGQWPEGIEFVVRGPRGEGEGAAGDPPAQPPAPPVDVNSPAVQAAIKAALAANAATAEAEKAAILRNKEDILNEKKALADKYAAAEAKLAEIEAAKKAGELGVPTERYQAEIEAAAQAKYKAWEESQSLVLKDKDAKLTALAQELEAEKAARHRAWLERELVMGMIPEGSQMVHPGAWDTIVNALAGAVEAREVEGLPGLHARVKIGGTFMPGTGPDGLMTPAELMQQARQGKGPFAKLSYCFVSAGVGSETVNPAASTIAAGRKWAQLNDTERSRMWKDDPKRARELVDLDMAERAKQATPGSRRAAA